jgi:LPS-assembly protein
MSRALHRQLLAVSFGTLLVPAFAGAREKPDWNPQEAPVARAVTETTSSFRASEPAKAEDPVLLEADSIEQGDEQGVLIAKGNVTARNKDRTIRADQIFYNQNTGIVRALGHVTAINADGSTTFADELTLDDELASGVAGNFASKFADGSTLAANAVVTREGDRKLMSQAVYTACPVCKDGKTKPSWIIRARRALQNERDESIIYNDVVFEVKGVPVLYIPYFAHGDPSAGRRSGFLQPKPGESSRNGYFIEQPYLQVIDASSDITLTPIFSQYINPVLQLDYRRKFYSGALSLNGTVTKEKFFGKRGKKIGESDWRGHIFGNGEFKIDDQWNWGFTAESASDDLYLFRYRIGQENLQAGLVRPQASRLMSQLYVQGQSEHFYVRSLSAVFQDLVPGERRKNVPRVAPLLEGTYRWQIGPMNGRFDVSGSAVSLMRTEGRLDSIRGNLGATWRGTQILPGGLVFEPTAMVRGDYFDYSTGSNSGAVSTTPLKADSFGRGVGLASADLRWPLVRPGNRFNLTLEPRITFTVASKDDQQSRVRVEDALGFEMDATSLFRPAGAAGMDLWEPGSRVSLGVRAGIELLPTSASTLLPLRANAFLGRRIRTDDANAFSRASNLDRKESDWVSDFEVRQGDYGSLTGRLRIDGETGKLVHTEAIARLKLWRTETSLRYHEFSPSTSGASRANKELQGSVILTLNKNFKLFGSLYRDYNTDTNLRSAYGLIYGDECTDFRIFYEELGTRNRFIEPSQSIRFQIAFRTLGELTDAPFD